MELTDNTGASRSSCLLLKVDKIQNGLGHGLRTPNAGINQRNLKFWADVADKVCFGRINKFGIGI